MFKASAGKTLPTSIIGSLPRPSWYTAVLGARSFLEAMVNSRYREQYEDAVSVHLRAQEIAGLDICTDGDAHFDEEVGGMSWQGYPLRHMAGFDAVAAPAVHSIGGAAFPRGHILHDYLEARVFPRIVGPVGPGRLQYAAMWKVAQRLTEKPIKFGTILPELLAATAMDGYYKDPVERTMALSDALNRELNELADAGCPAIQLEEPQIHMVPARGKALGKLDAQDLVGVFNNTVKGLRAKTEVWCHTCWGNPSQQRMFKDIQSYQPTLEALNQVDADALTFETCSWPRRPACDRPGDQGQEDRHRRDRSPYAAGRAAGRGRGLDPRGVETYSARTADHLVGLRNGPRGHEPAACGLQDGRHGARHQRRAQGARALGSRMPGSRPALLVDPDQELKQPQGESCPCR
jgi:5-methyltetrahydropteroyltriglutamate--homocysteine methyltransferase